MYGENDIENLDKLQIKTASGNLAPRIYANGKNQLPIEITAKALNKDGKPLEFSKEMWIKLLNLRFAESDQKLNLKGSLGWCFTDVENEYSKEIIQNTDQENKFVNREDGTAVIILYVYTDEIDARRIAVSVDTENGKHFTTADNASGAEKMSVSVTAIPRIDYGDERNISIIDGDFTQLSDNLGWTSRFSVGGPYYENYNGTCKRRIVTIQPNTSTTGQKQFKSHEVIYDPIPNNEVNQDSIQWAVGQGYEDCFDVLNQPSGLPCAVIGRDINGHYQLNLWFAHQNFIHINGQMYTNGHDHFYRFVPFVKENHPNDDKHGSAKLVLYKFSMPINWDTYQWGWKNVIRSDITVKLTDNYGNSGELKLVFDDQERFDTPGFQ